MGRFLLADMGFLINVERVNSSSMDLLSLALIPKNN
jgi:hypothetical protein